MNKNKRIFIIGHSGAGKGLIAKTLAEKLGWQFIDADLGLEARVGRYLAEIVGKPAGVQAFFQCQTEILNNQIKLENIVVATDASLLASETNKKLLSTEFVVYLQVSTPIQIERLLRNSETLLPTKNLKDFLDAMHNERDSVYENAASLVIDSDDSALHEHVATIINGILGDTASNEISEEIKLDRKDLILFHKLKYVPVHLTEQQAKCLKLLSQGKTAKEIANSLHISYRTVEEYIAKTMGDLGCATSKELIALYHDQP